MSRAKAGRKRKNGQRYPSGRLVNLRDNGADGVIRRKAIYSRRSVVNGEVKIDDSQTFDAIGRAWSAGLLVNPYRDDAVIRDQGRELHALYWAAYGVGQGRDTLGMFMSSRAAGNGAAARERSLNIKLGILASHGLHVRRAVDALCIDSIECDSGPPWLDRLIVCNATDADWQRLELAIRGLVALS